MDKQTETYEKNAQTDFIKDFMGQALNGNSSGVEILYTMMEQLEKSFSVYLFFVSTRFF